MRGQTPHGTRIRRLRKTLGLTQEGLASNANCDVKTVRNAEAGRRLDLSTLNRIAAALSVEVGELLLDSIDQHREWVEHWIDAFNSRHVKQLLAFYREDATLSLPSKIAFPGSGTHRGHQEIERHYQDWFQTVRIQFTRHSDPIIHPQSRTLMLRGRVTGVMIENAHQVSSEVLHEFRTTESVIVAHFVLLDTTSLLQSP